MGKTNEVIMSRPIGLKQFIESAPATEALTMQQRLARARSLKKNKAKIAIGRKKAARKIADMETLKKRARKQARNLLLKKITKDIPKGELSFARRQSIEKQLDKKKAVIDKIAKKLLPKVRKAEIDISI